MAKFVNNTIYRQRIIFEDGETLFLRAGEVFESNKNFKSVSDGVEVTEDKVVEDEVSKQPRKRKTTIKTEDTGD